MEADIANKPVGDYVVLCRKAWTAYVSLTLWTLLLLALVLISAASLQPPVAILISAPALLWLLYKLLLLLSVRLYYDDVGVWVYQGILPWSKGMRGVKWRDMDESTFETGFWSWILRSYTVRISHRFTKESEILLTHMYKGKEVSQQINQLLIEKVRQQSLH